MISVTLDQPFFPQLTNLRRKTAAVNLKIIGKLLPIKGNIKAIVVGLFCVKHQVSHQFFSGGTLGCDLYPLLKHDRLGSQILHQIQDHLLMGAAVIGTDM